MKRRLWPAVLSVFALLILGSYLWYTQFLTREIKRVTGLQAGIYQVVQRGLTGPDTLVLGALFDVQEQLEKIDIPIVIFNAAGQVQFAINIPDHPELDPRTPEGDSIARHYAAMLNSRDPEARVVSPAGGEVTFGESPLLRKLKWVPWFQAAGAILLLTFLVSIMRSDQRAERERLYAAMARELAHQMGTPLSSLAGWVEVLQLPDEARQVFTTTERIGDVMQADVERLERVSRRFELIGKPQMLQIVAMSDVIEELESYFRPRLPRMGAGIHLRTSVQSNMPPVRANQVLLVWALENVIKNAVDALAGKGGRIFIGVHAHGDGAVHLHIADNGPGIDPKVRDRIFETGVSTKSAGWGVGLALTRRIIDELHHGKVSARSRRARGTVFDVTLPTADASAAK